MPDYVEYLTQSQQESVLLDSVPYGRQGPWAVNIWAKLGDQWGQDFQVWMERGDSEINLYCVQVFTHYHVTLSSRRGSSVPHLAAVHDPS